MRSSSRLRSKELKAQKIKKCTVRLKKISQELIDKIKNYCLHKNIAMGTTMLKATTKDKDCYCNKETDFPCGPLSGCILRATQIECTNNRCSPTCLNQSIQLSKFPRVTVEPAGIKGLGLYAEEVIERNDIIIEYVGEIIEKAEYNRRRRQGMVDYCVTYGKFYIDSYKQGNFARFSNSSHRPNCQMFPIDAGDELRLALVSCKKIMKGEEIVWDYGKDYKGPCYCNEANCSGQIGM